MTDPFLYVICNVEYFYVEIFSCEFFYIYISLPTCLNIEEVQQFEF